VITYYLQKRHIFGDMKLEVLDSTGKHLATLPTSKRRGLSRVTWSMRMPPARIPPAATAAFGPGPRFMPGTYTVPTHRGRFHVHDEASSYARRPDDALNRRTSSTVRSFAQAV
jgi:hypothetical protein